MYRRYQPSAQNQAAAQNFETPHENTNGRRPVQQQKPPQTNPSPGQSQNPRSAGSAGQQNQSRPGAHQQNGGGQSGFGRVLPHSPGGNDTNQKRTEPNAPSSSSGRRDPWQNHGQNGRPQQSGHAQNQRQNNWQQNNQRQKQSNWQQSHQYQNHQQQSNRPQNPFFFSSPSQGRPSKQEKQKNFLFDLLPPALYNQETKKILGLITAEDLLLVALIFMFLDTDQSDNQLLVYALLYLLLSDYIDLPI